MHPGTPPGEAHDGLEGGHVRFATYRVVSTNAGARHIFHASTCRPAARWPYAQATRIASACASVSRARATKGVAKRPLYTRHIMRQPSKGRTVHFHWASRHLTTDYLAG